MNKVILIGRIAKNVELLELGEKKTKVINNCLAVQKNKDEVNYFDFKAFNGTADILSKYATKGDKIAITGVLDVDVYNTQDGKKVYNTVILVNEVELLGSKKEDKEEKKEPTYQDVMEAIGSKEEKIKNVEDEDLPF